MQKPIKEFNSNKKFNNLHFSLIKRQLKIKYEEHEILLSEEETLMIAYMTEHLINNSL